MNKELSAADACAKIRRDVEAALKPFAFDEQRLTEDVVEKLKEVLNPFVDQALPSHTDVEVKYDADSKTITFAATLATRQFMVSEPEQPEAHDCDGEVPTSVGCVKSLC